jgi:hypothetical protein
VELRKVYQAGDQKKSSAEQQTRVKVLYHVLNGIGGDVDDV